MNVSPLNSVFNLNRSITDARDVLDDLQRQLASGKKATTYAGLGADRTQVLSFRAELSQLEGYQRTATITDTRLQTMNLSLEHMRELAADTRSDALSGNYTIQIDNQTNFQVESRARFVDIVGQLNTRVGDNYVFGGRATLSPPVAPAEEILEGTATKAGFRQVADQRRQADLGADGLGRLEIASFASAAQIPASVNGEVITLTDTLGNAANVTLATGQTPSDVAASITTAISGLTGVSVGVTGGQLDFSGTVTLSGSATGLTAVGLSAGIISDNPPAADTRTGVGGFTDGSGGVNAAVNGEAITLTDATGSSASFTLTTGQTPTALATAINGAGLSGITVDGSSGQLVFTGTGEATLGGSTAALTEIGFSGVNIISDAPVTDIGADTGTGGFPVTTFAATPQSVSGEVITLTDTLGNSANVTLGGGQTPTDVANSITAAIGGLTGVSVAVTGGQLDFAGTLTLSGSTAGLTAIGLSAGVISDSAPASDSRTGTGGFTDGSGGINAAVNGESFTLTDATGTSASFALATGQSPTDLATAINAAGLTDITVDGTSGQLVFTGTGEATLGGSVAALTELGFAGVNIISDAPASDVGADTGAGGFTATDSITDTVSLREDGNHPFGFKISSVLSTLQGTTVTPTIGPPATQDITFSNTLPQDGETITFTFDLPDGSNSSVTLTARTGTAAEPGEFLIGADDAETAANFQTTLQTSLEDAAQTDLRAASLFEAADNFFDITDTATPQRVDGPPYDTATALVAATDTDTVLYYQGEISSSSARASNIAKVDDSLVVSTGARANEDAFRDVLKTFAVLAIETFDVDNANDEARYSDIVQRVHDTLRFDNGTQSIDNIITELTVAHEASHSATERHTASEALLTTFLDEAENSNIYEVSAQILDLQTRLEASLAVTATLSQTSLINYL